MAGSRGGLFDNLNIPRFTDAQHAEKTTAHERRNAWVGVGLPRRDALSHSGKRGPTAPTCALRLARRPPDRVPRPPDANAARSRRTTV